MKLHNLYSLRRNGILTITEKKGKQLSMNYLLQASLDAV